MKQNLHRIWIAMENPLVKRRPGWEDKRIAIYVVKVDRDVATTCASNDGKCLGKQVGTDRAVMVDIDKEQFKLFNSFWSKLGFDWMLVALKWVMDMFRNINIWWTMQSLHWNVH